MRKLTIPDWMVALVTLTVIFTAVNVILFCFINWLGVWGLLVSVIIFATCIIALAMYDKHIHSKKGEK